MAILIPEKNNDNITADLDKLLEPISSKAILAPHINSSISAEQKLEINRLFQAERDSSSKKD